MMFRDSCPVCNALLAYDVGGEVRCPYCRCQLLIGTSDPTGHYLAEIDPDLGQKRYGVFHFNLHPVGTYVCVVCTRVYPTAFECCPGLVDVAFEACANPSDDWGPKTAQRISEFLHSHPHVVKNTAQLRLLQSRFGEIGAEIGDQVRKCIEDLGLNDIIPEIADRLRPTA